MENASKALLMAASLLISMLIISLGVYLFVTFGALVAENNRQMEVQYLNQFNSKFNVYLEKENVTIYDVITAANLATENNVYYELVGPATGIDNYIEVKFINKDIPQYNNRSIEKGYENGKIAQNNINYYNTLLQKGLEVDLKDGVLAKYDCKVEISNTTGRVYLVTFSRKFT